MDNIFYFGHIRNFGHGLAGTDLSYYATLPADYPEKLRDHNIDARLAPQLGGEPEGVAAIHHVDGWTAIAFWDRSGDARFKSNSAFIARGILQFDEILALARESFPSVFERFKFEVKPCWNQ